jgi:hypothetical protein
LEFDDTERSGGADLETTFLREPGRSRSDNNLDGQRKDDCEHTEHERQYPYRHSLDIPGIDHGS